MNEEYQELIQFIEDVINEVMTSQINIKKVFIEDMEIVTIHGWDIRERIGYDRIHEFNSKYQLFRKTYNNKDLGVFYKQYSNGEESKSPILVSSIERVKYEMTLESLLLLEEEIKKQELLTITEIRKYKHTITGWRISYPLNNMYFLIYHKLKEIDPNFSRSIRKYRHGDWMLVKESVKSETSNKELLEKERKTARHNKRLESLC